MCSVLGLKTEGAESVWGAVVTGRPTSPCLLSSPSPQQPDVRRQGQPAVLGVGMFAVGRAWYAFLGQPWFLGFSRTFGCCGGSAPEAEGRAGDQDDGLVPQAGLALRSASEPENHLTRAAACTKVEGRLRSPKQDILFFTFMHLFFLTCNVFIRFINQRFQRCMP